MLDWCKKVVRLAFIVLFTKLIQVSKFILRLLWLSLTLLLGCSLGLWSFQIIVKIQIVVGQAFYWHCGGVLCWRLLVVYFLHRANRLIRVIRPTKYLMLPHNFTIILICY